mmetsp:Transcript_65999/g.212905  ORF Transcript_65999/g.212905 Transcript_65999/m.212905 type:complete len:273 (-) Transcript_65999:181-999(-)
MVGSMRSSEVQAPLQLRGAQAAQPIGRWKSEVLRLRERLEEALDVRLLRQQAPRQARVLQRLPAGRAEQAALAAGSEVRGAAAAAVNGEAPGEVRHRFAALALADEVELALERAAALGRGPEEVVGREVADLDRLARRDRPHGHQPRLARVLAGHDDGIRRAAVVCPADRREDHVVAAATLGREGEGIEAEDTSRMHHVLEKLLRCIPQLPNGADLAPNTLGYDLVARVQRLAAEPLETRTPAAPSAALRHRSTSLALREGPVQLHVLPATL